MHLPKGNTVDILRALTDNLSQNNPDVASKERAFTTSFEK